MQKKTRMILTILIALVMVSTLSGCTNWKKKHDALNVEHQNLKGLYENCVASLDSSSAAQADLSQKLSASQMTIEDLQRQRGGTPDTGFEVGQVSVDPEAGTITVTLENAILFSSGSAKLKSATSSELNHVYSVIKDRYAGKQIDVVGHTDTDPIRKTKKLWKDNWDLSAGRALTVVRYLVGRGMPSGQIRAVACGESRPVASNATSRGKAKNRRVEIVVRMR